MMAPAPPNDRLAVLAERTVRRSRLAAFLGTGSVVLLWTSVGLAAALVLGRSLFGVDLLARSGLSGPMLALIAMAVAAVTGTVRAWRRGWTAERAALWIDLQAGATGEVVTAGEIGGARSPWRTRAVERAATADAHYPVPTRRPLVLAAAALVVLALSLLAPIRTKSSSNRLAGLFEERIEEARDQLEALDEEIEFEEREALSIEEALDRLEAEADDDADLEATYEAIDRLEERMAERAEEAAEVAERASDALEELVREPASPESVREAREALAEMAREFSLAPLDPMNPSADLPKALQDALAKALESMEDLADAGLANPESAAALAELPELTAEQLEMLASAIERAEAELLADAGEIGASGEP